MQAWEAWTWTARRAHHLAAHVRNGSSSSLPHRTLSPHLRRMPETTFHSECLVSSLVVVVNAWVDSRQLVQLCLQAAVCASNLSHTVSKLTSVLHVTLWFAAVVAPQGGMPMQLIHHPWCRMAQSHRSAGNP